MKIHSTTKTSRTVTIRLTSTNILDLLGSQFDANIAKAVNRKVTFDVPSGGDYSGMRLDISDFQSDEYSTPIEVTYTIENSDAE